MSDHPPIVRAALDLLCGFGLAVNEQHQDRPGKPFVVYDGDEPVAQSPQRYYLSFDLDQPAHYDEVPDGIVDDPGDDDFMEGLEDDGYAIIHTDAEGWFVQTPEGAAHLALSAAHAEQILASLRGYGIEASQTPAPKPLTPAELAARLLEINSVKKGSPRALAMALRDDVLTRGVA